MNILKKQLAPLTENAWKEINDQAKEIFKVYLTGRKFVDIDGPNGLEQGAVSTGRLLSTDHSEKGINYGLREVLPLIEIRKPFELDHWEMDNIERGAKDIDLESLEKAAKQVASFEENLIYKGLKEGKVAGLENSTSHPKVKLPATPEKCLKVIGEQVQNFEKEGIEGPYTLIINGNKWKEILSLDTGYPVVKKLEEVLKVNKVIVNHGDFNSYLITERGGDFELSVGQDISIGYEGIEDKKIKLFFMESLTFRVIGPEAVIILEN